MVDICDSMPIEAMARIYLASEKRSKAAKMAENQSSSCKNAKNKRDPKQNTDSNRKN